MISIIVAIAKNGVIGDKNSLLWHLREDMIHFRTTTSGHPVVMGRKTLESLPGGKPLPKRTNVVITRDSSFEKEGCQVLHSIEEFLEKYGEEDVMVMGGAEMLGWIAPRFSMLSTSRSYFSWLLPKREYVFDARIKGGERHMIMSNEYDKVFPMDIYPEYLIKAIITGNIDKMEELGIYEVAPEDFALCEFVDSSKLELQRIVREGLDKLRAEMC